MNINGAPSIWEDFFQKRTSHEETENFLGKQIMRLF